MSRVLGGHFQERISFAVPEDHVARHSAQLWLLAMPPASAEGSRVLEASQHCFIAAPAACASKTTLGPSSHQSDANAPMQTGGPGFSESEALPDFSLQRMQCILAW